MVNPWVIPAVLVVAAVCGYLSWRRGRSEAAGKLVYVAHTERLRANPRYRARLARLRLAGLGLLLCSGLAVFSAAAIAARPSYEKVDSDALSSRDIVLCLDVSGSVLEFDAEVLETFSKIVDKFDGERVGLVIFNGSSKVSFPLTDDYEMIQEELKSAVAIFEDPYFDIDRFHEFIAGTQLGDGSSLIGDGLVSCTHSFDYREKDRSRTVLFATDNRLAGQPIFKLQEATDLAQKRKIRVYGLLVGFGGGYAGVDASEFKSAIEGIGGTVYSANDAGAGEEIVKRVQDQDEKELAGDVDVSVVDEPGHWPLVALVGVAGIVTLAWRFRL